MYEHVQRLPTGFTIVSGQVGGHISVCGGSLAPVLLLKTKHLTYKFSNQLGKKVSQKQKKVVSKKRLFQELVAEQLLNLKHTHRLQLREKKFTLFTEPTSPAY